MPLKGYKQTEEHKNKIKKNHSKYWLGKKRLSSKVKITCGTCGKNFLVSKYRKYISKFCSNICLGKSKIGKSSWNEGKKLSEETKQKISISKKGKKLSDEHRKKISASGKKRWEKIKKKRPRYYHSTGTYSYKKWRKAVFERDNYACQECGAKKVYLVAHHIKSWARFPELRFIVNNGLTLCLECHKLTDNYKNNKYGNRKYS